MKLLATVLALLGLVAMSHAQTPISSFPYFYDWTGAASFSGGSPPYVGGDGRWATNNTAQFSADGVNGFVKATKNTVDTVFIRVDATGRSFSGTEIFTFGAWRAGGGTTGTLKVYANSTEILSKDVNADLTTTERSFAASLPPALGGTVFYISVVVNANNNVWIDNTGISGGALPITLSSIKVNLSAESPVMTWTTLSEIDNYGFYVEKSQDMMNWTEVASSFQQGYGTTTETHVYTFTDHTLPAGNYYRLHQVDLDGTSHYSEAVSAVASAEPASVVNGFALNQSYPNPFNPSTTISYSLAKQAHTTLTIFNALGEQVATLVNEVVSPGEHSVVWHPTNLSSGTYFYVLKSDNNLQVRKTLFVK